MKEYTAEEYKVKTELEKIKEEIMKRYNIICQMNCNTCGWFPCAESRKVGNLKDVMTVIDKHLNNLGR